MGGVCSGGTVKKKTNNRSLEVEQQKASGFSGKLKPMGSFGKRKNDDSYAYPHEMDGFEKGQPNLYDSGELYLSISRELKSSTHARTPATKAPQVSSFLGKAGIMGLEKAVEVLDTLGSSMTNLNSGGFTTGVASRGNRISILAFEVANTVTKGANLLQSLSDENIQFLKKEVLQSEGIQNLVSTDMNELLSLAASDKREEFEVFSREVIRFGNLCKDPQWHNLDRFFSKLDSDPDVYKQPREEAEMTMQELSTLAQHTSELYHELHVLDRFDQDYRQKQEEVDSLHLPQKGETLTLLQSEVKHQRKLVRSLKKKSLWSKSLEEVVEKFVDVVTFIHRVISDAFGDNGLTSAGNMSANKPERLGVAGLALHYANIITQIDNIASRPTSLPPNMRDTLYNGLPSTVKTALRSQLQKVDIKEELTVRQIKAEMEKTLEWLVPVATDTTKAHQGFGWVGEWANTGLVSLSLMLEHKLRHKTVLFSPRLLFIVPQSRNLFFALSGSNEFGKKTGTENNLIRLQTLYHADKKKIDSYILDLVTWLHHLISLVRYRDNGIKALPARSPSHKGLNLHAKTFSNDDKSHRGQLSPEDRNLLEVVMKRRTLAPGRSKSQEFLTERKTKKKLCSSRSTGCSPRRGLEPTKADVLDILDGFLASPMWDS